MKIINIIKSAVETIGLLVTTFLILALTLWVIVSSGSIISTIKDMTSASKESETKNLELSSKAVSTINYDLLDDGIKKSLSEAKKESDTHQILINEATTEIDEILEKKNVHSLLKNARIISEENSFYDLPVAKCHKLTLKDVINNSALNTNHFANSIKKKHRINKNYINIHEQIFNVILNESCRIYKDRYSYSKIGVITLIATSNAIQ